MKKLLGLLAVAGIVTGCSKIEALLPPDLPDYEEPKKVVWLNQNWSD